MQAFLLRNKDYIAYLGLMMMILGLPLSRALLSIGIIFLFVVALLLPNVKTHFVQFIKNPALTGISLFTVYIILSGFWSDDIVFYLERVRIKLPFLVLPFAFSVLLPLNQQAYQVVLKTFFWLMAGCCLWSLFPLFTDYDKTIQDYVIGKVLRTPVYHIRFSLMVVVAVVIGYYTLKEKLYLFQFEKPLIMLFSIFLILYIHTLAVRSGLLAFYITATILLIKFFLEKKRYRELIMSFLVITILPYLAYQISPTFKTKFHYMKYDIEQYLSGNYSMVSSDIRRILSIRTGIEAVAENKYLGVGYGDIQQETFSVFDTKFPDAPKENRMLPHNQFVYTYTGIGIVGLIFFLITFFLPLYYQNAWKDDMVLAIHIIVFSSFIAEYTLETQIGVAFYLLFLLLPACQYWGKINTIKKLN